MHLKISGVRVMFRAIESFSFDQARNEFVLRTVSGMEYRTAVIDKAEAYRLAEAAIEAMALCEST